MMNERLKQLRKSLTLSQYEFGKRLGLTAPAISKIENFERSLTEQTILAVCREFNVNEDWLRNGTGEMFIGERQTFPHIPCGDNHALYAILFEIAAAYARLDNESRGIIDRFIKDVALAILGKDTVLHEHSE